MDYFVFKTDISTQKGIGKLKPIMKAHPVISDWSVDTKDIDRVLRVKCAKSLNEQEVIHLIQNVGFYCESLPD